MADDAEKAGEVDRATDVMLEAIIEAHRMSGLPLDAILAGAHIASVELMVRILGQDVTASCCDRAAAQVRSIPRQCLTPLALAVPAGRA